MVIDNQLQPICPACGGGSVSLLNTQLSAQLYHCIDCHLAFCHPFPQVASSSASDHSILTEESYTTQAIASWQSRQSLFVQTAQHRHAYFSQLLQRSSYRLLEIGCGIAGTADELKRLSVDYTGIDIDPRMVAAAQERGCKVSTCDLFDLDVTQKFDVVMFSQVLEHITAPRQFLERVKQLLTDDGIVVCDVPNHHALAGWPSKIKGSKSRFGAIELPHHAIAYNARSIRQLFQCYFPKLEVLEVTPKHPIWGQSVSASRRVSAYYQLSQLVRSPSLLVAIARP
jgi:2-polyprenyl-3-methyl-5-hydroxy-6-metoxy-1,4-benzoquinol methylase